VSKLLFTNQELLTICLFGHLQGLFEKKAIHRLIGNHWKEFFPNLPAYQIFVTRLNQLEPTFQTIGGCLQKTSVENFEPEIDRIVDSLPRMLAKGGHAYSARVARDVSDIGSCASKSTYFHAARLHFLFAPEPLRATLSFHL
jgi:hypothetical protein